jgi:hypothetical protein
MRRTFSLELGATRAPPRKRACRPLYRSGPYLPGSLGRRTFVKDLVRYLLENMYLDFQGEISLDTVRQFLRGDESREARAVLAKLIEDKGVDDLLLTLADCLKDHIRTGVSEQIVREQLSLYAES